MLVQKQAEYYLLIRNMAARNRLKKEKADLNASSSRDSSGRSKNAAWYALTLIVGVVFGAMYDPPAGFTKKDLLRSLDARATSSAPKDGLRVALGFNANVDVVVSGAPSLLRSCGVQEASVSVNHELLRSKEDFSASLRYFLDQGAAGERSFASDPVASRAFEHLVGCIDGSGSQRAVRVGGNAALMAVALHERFDARVLVGGQCGEKLAELLPDGIECVAAKEGLRSIENVPVNVKKDEKHIILEYDAGAKWGGAASSRANRFIVSQDASNSAIASAEAFFSVIKRAQDYDAVVLAGLHMLDGHAADFQLERLDSVRALARKVDASTALHFELASVGDETLMKHVAWTMLPAVDSLGLNEMELAALYGALGGDRVPRERLELSNPDPSDVFDAISFVFARYQPEGRALSRVHFHALGFHVIAIRTEMKVDAAGSATLRQWRASEGAVAAGSVAATLSGCAASVGSLHGNDLDLKRAAFVAEGEARKVSAESPVLRHSLDADGTHVDFYLAPVLVCKHPKGTVGLGDIISATGLAHQLQ